MTEKKTTRLVATVGVNLDDIRFEAGDTIKEETPAERKWLLSEGYAIEADSLTAKEKAAIIEGEQSPHPVVAQMDLKG